MSSWFSEEINVPSFWPTNGDSTSARIWRSVPPSEVSQKACGVFVPLVQRQPGGLSPATGDPFADQRGFAKAGGGGDEGQSAVVQTFVQPLGQAGTGHDSRLGLGNVEFGGQNRRRHGSPFGAWTTPKSAQPWAVGEASGPASRYRPGPGCDLLL
jgi:hypothetical protein